MIDQIIAYNKTFVEQKGYEKYLTSMGYEASETLVDTTNIYSHLQKKPV